MKAFRSPVLLALFAALPLCAAAEAPGFKLDQVADGVYAAIRTEPAGYSFVANSVFIVNDDDVVVVDTGIGPAVAREAIAALKKLTAKPVKYVVNTHWHDDHMMGNEAYRDAYPGVEFIGHINAKAAIDTTGAGNRKQLIENGPAFVAQLQKRLAEKKDLSEEERASHMADSAWGLRYFAEAPQFKPIAPTLGVETSLKLVRGARTIEVRFLGRAHTAEDLVVYLPKEKILISGDLVVWPIPLFGTTSFPIDYATTLEKMLAIPAAILIPGHGPVMRGDTYARSVLALLNALNDQVKAAAARGESLADTRKHIDLAAFRLRFAGDSALRGALFDNYVVFPGVQRAFQQVTGAL